MTRTVVAWWYAPELGTWRRWGQEPAASAGEALDRAANLAAWMPSGRAFVDVWKKVGGRWKHETRYRFGGEA